MEPIYPNSSDNCTETDDAFEVRFSTRPLRILKLLTPFLPVDIQPALAIMIRLQELKLVLHGFHITGRHTFPALFSAEAGQGNTNSHDGPDSFSPELMNRLLKKIDPLLLPEEQKEIGKIRQMLQMLETYKQLEPYMSMFSQMSSMSQTAEDQNTPEEDAQKASDDTDELSDCNQTKQHTSNDTGVFPGNLMSMLSPDMIQNLGSLMQIFTPDDTSETDHI